MCVHNNNIAMLEHNTFCANHCTSGSTTCSTVFENSFRNNIHDLFKLSTMEKRTPISFRVSPKTDKMRNLNRK